MLSLLFVKLHNDMIENQSVPLTIPVVGKKHQLMSNFQPLSVLHNNDKVVAKVLVPCLVEVISYLVTLVQVEYVAGYESANNMRILFKVKCSASSLSGR